MILTEESWHIVRNVRGVTGFVGAGGKPVPLTDALFVHFGKVVETRFAHYVTLPEVGERNLLLGIPGVYTRHLRRGNFGVRIVGVYVDKPLHHSCH